MSQHLSALGMELVGSRSERSTRGR